MKNKCTKFRNYRPYTAKSLGTWKMFDNPTDNHTDIEVPLYYKLRFTKLKRAPGIKQNRGRCNHANSKLPVFKGYHNMSRKELFLARNQHHESLHATKLHINVPVKYLFPERSAYGLSIETIERYYERSRRYIRGSKFTTKCQLVFFL